jgi:DNA-binding GntR family transcriptional regulator
VLQTNPAYSHKQLRNLVADQLRSAILEGRYQPGEWLRQERLAQELGVSQMPVREALKELAAEGLIEHLPYRGVRVVEFVPQDVADLYAHRSFLEGLAARSAAENITPEELAELRQVHVLMAQKLAPEDLAEYRELNRRFHQIVYLASRRTYLIRTLNQMWASFPVMLFGHFASTATRPLPERDAQDVEEHQAILAALQNRDGDEAERLVNLHIETTRQQLLAVLESDR